MVAEPAATPVTSPELFTVNIDVLLLLHEPPVTVFDINATEVTHTPSGPVMVPALGIGLTVTIFVEVLAPQLLVSV